MRSADIAIIGDVDDWETDAVNALLGLGIGGNCTFYIDSNGGSAYGALAVVTLMRKRKIKGTAVVLGECSSAAILVFAACQKREVTPLTYFVFHKIKCGCDEPITGKEAVEWGKNMERMEAGLDELMMHMLGDKEQVTKRWVEDGRFVTGKEMAEAGFAKLVNV